MNQRFVIILMLIALTLAACGGAATPTPSPEPTATAVPPTDIPATETPAPTATPVPVVRLTGPCFNLAETDCAIIEAAHASSMAAESFQFAYSAQVTASGLELLALLIQNLPNTISIDLSGDGAINITPDAEASVALALTSAGTIIIDDVTRAFDLPVTLHDGYIYSEITGEDGQREAVYTPLEDALLDGIELPLIGPLGSLVSFSALRGSEINSFGQIINLSALTGLVNLDGGLPEHTVDYRRGPDDAWEGQTVYPFQLTLDIGALVNTPQMSSRIAGLFVDPNSTDPLAGMMGQMIPRLLTGLDSQLVITRYVGADDAFVHRLTVDLTFALDLGTLTQSGASSADSGIPPVALGLALDVTVSDFNAPQTISAPPDARLLTLEEAQAEIRGFLAGQ